jgi:hypothetical protein
MGLLQAIYPTLVCAHWPLFELWPSVYHLVIATTGAGRCKDKLKQKTA